MPESYTPRGFADYVSFDDQYGNKVTVRQSSSGEESCVWIFCEAGGSWRIVNGENVLTHEPSPHLNVEHAIKVRDALTEFIGDNAVTPLEPGSDEAQAVADKLGEIIDTAEGALDTLGHER